jgi:hypothetical protein
VRPVAAVVLATCLLGTACGDGEETVDLSFRPPPGARYVYDLAAESATATALGGPPERREDEVALRVEEAVLDSRPGHAVRLRFTVRRAGEERLTFDVRVEPEAGAGAVEQLEGLPVEFLGDLGPSRLFPLAAGLLPGRPVRPGATWSIDRQIAFADEERRLTGSGRVAGLRLEDRVPLARVVVRTVLPVSQRLTLPEGRVIVTGDEVTEATIEYDVRDGVVHTARSHTEGRFDLSAAPATASRDNTTLGLTGTLTVTIDSRAERVDARSAGGRG